jgi:hypothetical protein
VIVPLTAKATLIDVEDTAGRTTATLVASLAARLSSLYFISGADAIASLTSGFAELGREVSKTVEGARLREAFTTSRVVANGEALWRTLRIGDGASTAVPSPVLAQLRNDVALLLADDLDGVLGLLPIPAEAPTGALPPPQQTVTFLDFIIGYWAFSKEVLASLEALAKLGRPSSAVHPGPEPVPPLKGSLLR